MPQRRRSQNFDLSLLGLEFAVQVGFYDDGRMGEVFVSSQKTGSMAEVNARDAAVLLSIVLQHGAEPKKVLAALTHDVLGKPEGVIGKVLEKLIEEYCQ